MLQVLRVGREDVLLPTTPTTRACTTVSNKNDVKKTRPTRYYDPVPRQYTSSKTCLKRVETTYPGRLLKKDDDPRKHAETNRRSSRLFDALPINSRPINRRTLVGNIMRASIAVGGLAANLDGFLIIDDISNLR